MTTYARTAVTLIVTVLFGTTLAQAQWSGPEFADERYRDLIGTRAAATFYRVLRAHAMNQGNDWVGAEVVRAIDTGETPLVAGSAVCAYLAGAGQNPKWDGGGGLASTAFGGTGDARLRFSGSVIVGDAWDSFGLGAAPPTAPIVVMDAFDLDLLSLPGSLHGFQFVGDPVTDGPALWHVLVDAVDHDRGGSDPLMSEVPHGHVVLYHLVRSMSLLGDGRFVDVTRSPHAPSHAVLTIDGGPSTVVVHLLAIEFADVDSITDAFAVLRDADLDGAVVNMSWALVDCAVEDAFRRASSDDDASIVLQDYARYITSRIAEVDGNELVALLTGICRVSVDAFHELTGIADCDDVIEPFDLIPVLTIAALAATDAQATEAIGLDQLELSRPVYVAAAGNQGLSFPMPPASWPGVLGVASCQAANGSTLGTWPTSFFSNAPSFHDEEHPNGAIAVGAFFARPDALEGQHDYIGYYGTSFAAPAVTARIAAYGVGSVSGGGAAHVNGFGFAVEPCGPFSLAE